MKKFELRLLKGKLGEEIAKYHFEQMGFEIVRTGKEELFKDLIKIENKNQFISNLIFNIYETILSKLPDFLVFKKDENKMFFVEIKYRDKIDLEQCKLKNTYEYALEIFIEESDKNKNVVKELEIIKYIENLDFLHKKVNSESNYWSDFYVYLIANNSIYFGRVYKNTKEDRKKFFEKNGIEKGEFTLKLFTPEGVEQKYNKKEKKWPKFKIIADQIKKEILK